MANNLTTRVTADVSQHNRNIQSAANEVSKYSYQTKKAQKELKNFQKSANDAAGGLANIFSGFRSGNMAQMSVGFKSVSDNLDGILPKLTELGPKLINPWTLGATAIIGGSKALYDYNVELEKTLEKTEQFTGLSGNAAMSLRNGIQSVASTFGKDFNTILSSVDGMMSQFHIDGESALNIIRDGFVSGADEGGKMLDMISKYSGAFNDAGISANEMVAIIGNTRSGIFSEEGMELFSKGAMKIREFSDSLKTSLESVGINADEMYQKLQSGEITTVQAIQQISNQLKGLSPQSKEVGDVMADVFGKKAAAAGYELVTALADVETDLDKVKQQTGDWGQAMEDLQTSNRNMENALSSLFGIADGGFDTMTTKLKADVYQAVADVINGFIEWYNKSELVRSSIATIGYAFEQAWYIIRDVCKLIMGALGSLSEMIQGVFELDWDRVKAGWNKGAKDVLKAVSDFAKDSSEAYKKYDNMAMNGQIKLVTTVDENPDISNNTKSRLINNTEKQLNSNKSNTPKLKVSGGSKSSNEPKFEENSKQYWKDKISQNQKLMDSTVLTNDELRNIISQNEEYQKQLDILERREKYLLHEKDLLESLNTSTLNLGDPQKQLEDGLKNANVRMLKQADEFKEKWNNSMSGIGESSEALSGISSAFGSIGSAMEGTEGKMIQFAASSINAIAQLLPQISSLIVAKQGEAQANAAASAMSLKFPACLPALATVLATIASVFSSIPKFADGGIIGGNTSIGDYNIARVNSGEMILNQGQQQRLFNIINGTSSASKSNMNGGTVEFKISGSNLVGTLDNYNKKKSKVK